VKTFSNKLDPGHTYSFTIDDISAVFSTNGSTLIAIELLTMPERTEAKILRSWTANIRTFS
jgi:hypothetical protein